MNLVIDDAVEVKQATKTEAESRRPLGKILLLQVWNPLTPQLRSNIAERRQRFPNTKRLMFLSLYQQRETVKDCGRSSKRKKGHAFANAEGILSRIYPRLWTGVRDHRQQGAHPESSQ
jgi:hypothetical protein